MDVVRGAGDESRVQVVQTVRIELAQPLIHSAKPVVRYEILPQDRIQVADIVARADDLADAPPEAGRETRVALIPWLVQRMVEGPRMSTHACIPLRTPDPDVRDRVGRSEEHTSEPPSLMRNRYAVFYL